MTRDMQQLIEGWDGLGVVARYDRPTATWIFIAIHDTTLGTPVGGSRMKIYSSPEEGLWDALRLAEGMTHKWASAGVQFGGGKAVLALSRTLSGDERRGLLKRYARLLNALGGCFSTGEDLGTTPEDMRVLAAESPHIHGFDPDTGQVADPGPYTALGVFIAMRSALAHVFSDDGFQGRRVFIQGVGDVGTPLAGLVREAGGAVLISDLDHQRAHRVAAKIGGSVVESDAVWTTTCDVYAPCAVGATLNRDTIPQLQCRIVAGSANNQLAEASDAERLVKAGILYGPDYIVNAGGAIAFAAMARGERDESALKSRVVGLGTLLTEVFEEARERDESPVHAARRRVERLLARGADVTPVAPG